MKGRRKKSVKGGGGEEGGGLGYFRLWAKYGCAFFK